MVAAFPPPLRATPSAGPTRSSGLSSPPTAFSCGGGFCTSGRTHPAGAAPGRAVNVLRDEDPRPEDDELDEELAAYNRYLAELHAEDQRKLP